jgi:hypothetical protein
METALLAAALVRSRAAGGDVGTQSRRHLAELVGHPAKGRALALVSREIADQVAIIGIVEQFGQPGLHVFHGSNHGGPAAEKELHMWSRMTFLSVREARRGKSDRRYWKVPERPVSGHAGAQTLIPSPKRPQMRGNLLFGMQKSANHFCGVGLFK